jgi:hypothetical protein
MSVFLGNQPHPQREAHQARHVVDIQAIHQLHAMVFHGLEADLQEFNDAFGVLPSAISWRISRCRPVNSSNGLFRSAIPSSAKLWGNRVEISLLR